MSNKKTVLLIEDNPDDAEHYTEMLEQCSPAYKVLHADNGADGIALFKKYKIDCTLIDYNLPQMDGLEILDQILKSSVGYVATIILTGEPHQKIQAEAARKGALDYMIKDIGTTPEKLSMHISKTIDWADRLNNEQKKTVNHF